MSSGVIEISRPPRRDGLPKFTSVPDLRGLRECEQVAAICYRRHGPHIEFLLVRTRSGKWIFPKGNADPGLTHAQAAAIEAFEEAGVHGRMEEACFVRYRRHKKSGKSSKVSRETTAVNAHLCEVLRLERPSEAGRTPTWFSPSKTKRRLQEERFSDYGRELARVIDYALARIQRPTNQRDLIVDAGPEARFIDAMPRPAAREKKLSTSP